MLKGVSVIICCYNSESRIQKTLQYLSLQKTESLSWEIIIVDNASTDNTTQVALAYWKELNAPVKLSVLTEPQPGLSYARDTGIKSSSFDVIVFCDDDNWLSETYTQTAFNKMVSHPDAGIIGGWCEGEYEIPLKSWLEPMKSALAIGRPMQKGALSKWHTTVNGAGMVINKKIYGELQRIGFKSLLQDRKLNALTAGGDSELCWAIFFIGFEVYFFEELFFKHYMPRKRLSTNYFFKLTLDHVKHLIVLRMYPAIYGNSEQPFYKFFIAFSMRKAAEAGYGFIQMIFGKTRFRSLIQFLQSIKMLFVSWIKCAELRRTYQEISNFKIKCKVSSDS